MSSTEAGGSATARPDDIPGTNRRRLQSESYADSRKLRARGAIYRWRVPKGSIGEWVLGRTDWPAGCRVLDVGCGPGMYLGLLSGVRSVGVDLSAGMAREASAHAPALAGDAAVLPFASATFDRVLATHMLYHCPDIPATVRELRRVLRPGGVLVAVTNSVSHLAELRAVHRAAAGADPLLITERFNIENGGALLRESFTSVHVDPFVGEVVVPEVGPVVDYIESMGGWYGSRSPTVVRADLERLVGSVIERDGAFRARTSAGAFICS